MTRSQILANLHTSLASNRPWLESVANSAPHTIPPYVMPAADDLVEQFAAELRTIAGKVYVVADERAALNQIAALLAERPSPQIIAWDVEQIGLAGLPALLEAHGVTLAASDLHGASRSAHLQNMEPLAICISGVEAGIAESGSLVLRHGPGRPRLASLLAPCHIAILRRSQLVRGLGEALALLRNRYDEAIFTTTSNLTLITGPSRTADIEMTLSLGIHGPPEVHVILVG
ncbi:LutC/YkgG family protein [Candidatus Oscillochloris fontis]|uniref:LutC/YkgG family protein n=1 Tax=Candidatus Oscillochloris fontis TaxID=2496868 RepID=UPI00101BC750|nr:lactate utilization protein [Candidatus Oscillochloris fontis]